MKRLSIFLAISTCCCLAMSTGRTQAQTDTTFAYQGRLNQNGQPANGVFNLDFALFDAENAGNQIESEIMFNSVPVIDGLFAVDLDFGGAAFDNSNRWLQIKVNNMTLSPRQSVNRTPYAIQTRGLFVDDLENIGIGTTTPGIAAPGTKLDVFGGPILVSNTGDQADLLWLASDRSWVFRQESTGAGTALKLQSIGGGGNKNFIVQTDGLVGIGTTAPLAKLHVIGDIIGHDIDSASLSCHGALVEGIAVVQGFNSNNAMLQVFNTTGASGGIGIHGTTTNTSAFLQNMIGVHGSTASGASNSFGVFATGRLGASGTKSFRIDHPEDPENQYLFHYSSESPEVINFYRGTATLDAQGRAVVSLPSYFANINANPSYQLTAVGAPMPMLHISVGISDQTLQAGELQAPGDPPLPCWFEIDGGVPGGEVSWRVEAVRNDEFVRRNGAPVQAEKPAHESGMDEIGDRSEHLEQENVARHH